MNIWIKPSLSIVLGCLAITGCATKDSILPESGKPISEIYQEHSYASGGALDPQVMEARQLLRRPLNEREEAVATDQYTRNAATEIYSQFARSDNPDLLMYVFPHVTQEGLPVPGYTTVFPMYDSVDYAMPGEVRYDNESQYIDYYQELSQ